VVKGWSLIKILCFLRNLQGLSSHEQIGILSKINAFHH